LLHPTSLPGPHGIGDLGGPAFRFVDFLQASGLVWWQMLPIVPPGGGDSPYTSSSSFAGSSLLISPELLVEDGLLTLGDLRQAHANFPEGEVDFGAARRYKEPLLRKAFAAFCSGAGAAAVKDFLAFCVPNQDWLDDYSYFCALKRERGEASWADWPENERFRRFRRWGEGSLKSLGEEAFYQQFVQHVFQRQWARLREYAARRGVGLIGDVPIFVAHDSADVWANPEYFFLDSAGRPEVVAGVPPDYFSETGQLWGNPLYRWEALRAQGYDWWLARLKIAAARFDAVRLDHFIGFQRYWEIPAGAKTAREGRWVPGPGAGFFEAVRAKLPELELIAEDLGCVTPEVEALRDSFDLPGMRILQFAFGDDSQADSFLPDKYPRRCVAYTGTHDNDTVAGWFKDEGLAPGSRKPEQIRREREAALRYLSSAGGEIHWDMIGAVLRSTADTAIVPAQDLLGLGSEARMNRPGTAEGNWRWRLRAGALDEGVARRLRALAAESGRLPRQDAQSENTP
jgi:4-alpha-glucanotransferase